MWHKTVKWKADRWDSFRVKGSWRQRDPPHLLTIRGNFTLFITRMYMKFSAVVSIFSLRFCGQGGTFIISEVRVRNGSYLDGFNIWCKPDIASVYLCEPAVQHWTGRMICFILCGYRTMNQIHILMLPQHPSLQLSIHSFAYPCPSSPGLWKPNCLPKGCGSFAPGDWA